MLTQEHANFDSVIRMIISPFCDIEAQVRLSLITGIEHSRSPANIVDTENLIDEHSKAFYKEFSPRN